MFSLNRNQIGAMAQFASMKVAELKEELKKRGLDQKVSERPYLYTLHDLLGLIP